MGESLGIEWTPLFLRDRVVGREERKSFCDLLPASTTLGGGGFLMGEEVRCWQCH